MATASIFQHRELDLPLLALVCKKKMLTHCLRADLQPTLLRFYHQQVVLPRYPSPGPTAAYHPFPTFEIMDEVDHYHPFPTFEITDTTVRVTIRLTAEASVAKLREAMLTALACAWQSD